jgi:tetratricopeptide (TPR) repeat protein
VILVLPAILSGISVCSRAGLLVSVAGGQAVPVWMEPYQEATRQLQIGSLERATEIFEGLWKSHPKDFQLAYAIGTALDSTGHHREANAWYLKALRLSSQFGPAYNNLALNYVSQSEFAKALPLLEKATELDPHNEQAFYNLGLVHLQLKHFRQAAQAFRRAHELEPLERDPLARLAYASLRAGQRKEGQSALAALLKLPGERLQSALQAVRILNSVGMHQEALGQAQQARQAGLGSPSLSYEEAKALFHLGEYKQTSKLLLDTSPPDGLTVDYYLLLGSAQALGGDLPGAVKTLQTAVQITPQRPEPYYRLALVFLEGYRDQDAEQVLTEGLQHIPNSPQLHYGLGVVHEVGGKYQDAVSDMRKSLNAQPGQSAVWTNLGDLYVKLGQYDKALEAYETANQRAHETETALRYADLLIRLQRYAQAEELLKRTLGQEPRQGRALVSLGKLYVAERNYTQAENALRQAVKRDPNNSDAHLFLGRALEKLGRTEEGRREIALASEKRETERESTRLLRGVLVPTMEDVASPDGENRAHH